jgi:hypothetical protein
MEVEYYIRNMFELQYIKQSQNENMLLQSHLICIIIFFLDIRYVFDAPKFNSSVSRSNFMPEERFEQDIRG